MISTINRYMISRTLKGLALAAATITSIIMLVDFVEGTRQIGSNSSISAVQVFFLTALKTPRLIEQTIPFIVLFGIMSTLSGLNKRSELIILRAAGQSVWKFLKPVIWVSALLGVFWAFAFNPLASAADRLRVSYLANVTGVDMSTNQPKKIWLREGTEQNQLVIMAESLTTQTQTLHNVKFWVYEQSETGNSVFKLRMDADKAVWSPNYWQLSKVVENTLTGERSETEFLSWPTTLSYDDVFSVTDKTRLLSLLQINKEIKRMTLSGFSVTNLRIQWHSLLVLPLSLIAMTLIAAGATLHHSREGGSFRLIVTGCVLGFGVFFIENIFRAFGQSGSLPVILAVWSVPFFVMFCAIAYLTKIEDG